MSRVRRAAAVPRGAWCLPRLPPTARSTPPSAPRPAAAAATRTSGVSGGTRARSCTCAHQLCALRRQPHQHPVAAHDVPSVAARARQLNGTAWQPPAAHARPAPHAAARRCGTPLASPFPRAAQREHDGHRGAERRGHRASTRAAPTREVSGGRRPGHAAQSWWRERSRSMGAAARAAQRHARACSRMPARATPMP